MSLKLTKEQDAALKKIQRWLKNPAEGGWKFSLAGYAGTGKTTMLARVLEGLKPGTYVCCAPTGKAASVLRSKLPGVDVRTAHSVLYTPSGENLQDLNQLESERQKLVVAGASLEEIDLKIRREKRRLAQEDVRFTIKASSELVPGKIVIVDESSMVSEKMMGDFENTGARVLFVGDPGQLPPVKESSWFIEEEHDAMLETIVRQALDSPIIRLSQEVRNGIVNGSQYADPAGAAWLTSKVNVDIQEHWMKASQVLTGSNAARHRSNRFFRKQLFGAGVPQMPVGMEKMICLKNDHYQLPEPWVNGVQFETTDPCDDPGDGIQWLNCNYGGIEQQLEFYPYHCLSHYTKEQVQEPREALRGVFEADYAYAITCHKSQGSEWDFVIVADDKMMFERKDFRKRWLYTAITRAKTRLIIAQ